MRGSQHTGNTLLFIFALEVKQKERTGMTEEQMRGRDVNGSGIEESWEKREKEGKDIMGSKRRIEGFAGEGDRKERPEGTNERKGQEW